MSLPPTVRFGPFQVDVRAGEVRLNGTKTKLPEQAFQILTALLEHPGEVVTREELRQRLWGADTFVDFEHGLNTAVKRLREALGDSAENPRFIETVPRHGYRLIVPVEGDEVPVAGGRLLSSSATRAVPQPRRVRTRNIVIASACLALLALAVVVVSRFIPRPSGGKTPQSAQTTPSIAVLPFVNMSSDKEQEYFSDGLSEELLNDLAKIPQLRVTARTSSFQFKGKNEDLRTIGEKLNVATVLEGSVRKQGNRVRIIAQLVKTSDGFHLWSETYDRNLTDVFAVQEEIARAVAASLRVTLLGKKVPTSRATSVEAYNAYLQGKYFGAYATRQPDAKKSFDKAIVYYEQAIKLDPSYAPAWEALARAYFGRANLDSDLLHLEKDASKAREAAERALALDPNLADAYATMGLIKHVYEWDWAGADACFQLALALEPGKSGILSRAAGLAGTLNHFEEALRLSRRAVELNPIQAGAYRDIAFFAWWAGRLEEAEAAGRKAVELNPNGVWHHMWLTRVYLAQARPQEALLEAERETAPQFRLQALALAYHALARKQESDRALAELIAKWQETAPFQIAEVYAFRGEADAAFQWLERSYTGRDAGLVYVKGDPLLKNIERDPRYAAFLKKMRLPLN